jgi:hypothetical protein
MPPRRRANRGPASSRANIVKYGACFSAGYRPKMLGPPVSARTTACYCEPASRCACPQQPRRAISLLDLAWPFTVVANNATEATPFLVLKLGLTWGSGS